VSNKFKFRRATSLIKSHSYLCLFILLYLAISLLTYKDYGPTSDEKVEYDTGKYLLEYYKKTTDIDFVNNLVSNGPNNIAKRHLPLFSSYSRIYPAVLNILNPNFYFEWFHLQNMIIGLFLFLSAYLCLYLAYKDQKKAIVAPILLLFTPVVYGHIPANPKDIPFASLYIFGVYLISKYLRGIETSKACLNSFRFILLGAVFGVATGIRTAGLTLPAIYFVAGAIKIFKDKEIKDRLVEHFFNTATIVVVSLFFWIVTVPFMGANFFANFASIFSSSIDFQYWNGKILYLGKFFSKNERPWHYLFVHLFIQLPIVAIAAILSGLFLALKRKIERKVKFDFFHPASILVFAILLDFALYLFFQPVVYNAARHYIFLMVCLVVLSAFFLVETYSILDKKRKLWILGGVSGYLFFTLIRMVRLHPYEYIYYNEFVGGLWGANQKFELDYWGTSYKEGAELVRSVVERNNLKNISVYSCNNQFSVVYYSQFMYDLASRSKSSDIILCDPVEEQLRAEAFDAFNSETHPVVKTILREGVPILKIRTTQALAKHFE